MGARPSPSAVANARGTTPSGPAPWNLFGLARREQDDPLNPVNPLHVNGSTPSTGRLTADPFPVLTTTASALGPDVVMASTPTTNQSLYTGQPSRVTTTLVLGLRVLNAITDALHLPSVFTLASKNVPFLSDGIPPRLVTLGLKVSTSEYQGWTVWTLAPKAPSGKEVVAIHGGAYVGQVNILQWITYADIARATGATMVVPLYPLAPQGTAATVVPQTADFLSTRIAERGAQNVSVLGDSAGGQIALSAAQLLVERGDPVPGHLVLLSPVLDNTLTNPAIATIDDPLLDPEAGYQNGLLWADGLPLTDPLVSPLYGSLAGLPPTTIYSGSLDLLSPDVLVLRDKAIAQGAPFGFELRNGEIHDWVIFPFLPEAIAERPAIYRQLGIDGSR